MSPTRIFTAAALYVAGSLTPAPAFSLKNVPLPVPRPANLTPPKPLPPPRPTEVKKMRQAGESKAIAVIALAKQNVAALHARPLPQQLWGVSTGTQQEVVRVIYSAMLDADFRDHSAYFDTYCGRASFLSQDDLCDEYRKSPYGHPALSVLPAFFSPYGKQLGRQPQ